MSYVYEGPSDHAGGRKRSAGMDSDHPIKRQHDEAIILFRVCCPSEKSGPVIGKGGEVIRAIRDATGARVKLDDNVRGLNERAIIIYSPDRPGEHTCGAQDALERVISRIFEPDGPDARPAPEHAELVLVIDRAYMALIVGKGGESVTRIRTTSSTSVVIQKQGSCSPLAGPDEETVVISGPYEGVKTAARMLTDRIRDGVNKSIRPAPSTLALAYLGPPGSVGGAASLSVMPGLAAPFRPPSGTPALNAPAPEGSIRTEYRLLVPEIKVGGLIGKGGDRLRAVREESRAEVVVEKKTDMAVANPERLVLCSSMEPPEAEYCAAAEALMMCSSRVVSERGAASDAGFVVLRLLAPAAQMVAVIGPRGSIARQIGVDTGARLTVMPRDLMGGPTPDEVLEIGGLPAQVMEAARIVTMLLRGIMIKHQVPRQAVPPPTYSAPAPPGPPAHHGATTAPYPTAPPQYGYATPAPVPAYGQPPPAPGPPQQYGQPYGAAPYQQYGRPAEQPPPPAAATQQQQYEAYYAAYGPTGQQPAPAPAPSPVPQQQYGAGSSVAGGYNPAPYQDPNGPPPPQTGYSLSPADGAPPQQSGYSSAYNPPQQHQQQAPSGYNQMPPPSMQQNGGSGSAVPTNPAIGSLFNPSISSTGLQPGMVRYTMGMSVMQVGTLLGSRGSNISAIRVASGARIKVQDNNPAQPERQVEVSGTVAQVSIAMTAIQTLVTSGNMPSSISNQH